MKPPRFEYACPQSLSEALDLLHQHKADAAVLAGGQSLMPMLNLRVARPGILIDINRIPELDTISNSGGCVSIGARARHNDVLRSPLVRSHVPLLAQALEHVAHEAIRNRGTLGGSLALADPAAELPACAVCLGAEIVAQSVRGERRVAASDCFRGLYTTAIEPDEIITRVDFPIAQPEWGFRFDEVARRHGDFAIAGLALGMRCEGAIVVDCRIVFSGVETSPRRIPELEGIFIGAELADSDRLTRAKERLTSVLEPLEGGELPPEYRLHVARELLARVTREFVAHTAPRDGVP
jgi:carbon-monoxide dehydrogenase medium subunit